MVCPQIPHAPRGQPPRLRHTRAFPCKMSIVTWPALLADALLPRPRFTKAHKEGAKALQKQGADS